MGNISNGMKTLCEDIVTAHGDRKRSIKDLREHVDSIRENARKFVRRCKRLNKEMALGLRGNLIENREESIKNVKSLRKDSQKKEKEIRTDLEKASKIWNEMNETLKLKKTRKGGERK